MASFVKNIQYLSVTVLSFFLTYLKLKPGSGMWVIATAFIQRAMLLITQYRSVAFTAEHNGGGATYSSLYIEFCASSLTTDDDDDGE